MRLVPVTIVTSYHRKPKGTIPPKLPHRKTTSPTCLNNPIPPLSTSLNRPLILIRHLKYRTSQSSQSSQSRLVSILIARNILEVPRRVQQLPYLLSLQQPSKMAIEVTHLLPQAIAVTTIMPLPTASKLNVPIESLVSPVFLV